MINHREELRERSTEDLSADHAVNVQLTDSAIKKFGRYGQRMARWINQRERPGK